MMFWPPLLLFQFFLDTEARTFFPEDYFVHVTTLLKNLHLLPNEYGICILVWPSFLTVRPTFPFQRYVPLSLLTAPARWSTHCDGALVMKNKTTVIFCQGVHLTGRGCLSLRTELDAGWECLLFWTPGCREH